jgi:hypothetical protein
LDSRELVPLIIASAVFTALPSAVISAMAYGEDSQVRAAVTDTKGIEKAIPQAHR